MEGPALAFKALLLVWVLMALYKRFERVHGRFPAFEAFIAERPVIVTLTLDDARHQALAGALEAGAVVLRVVEPPPRELFAMIAEVCGPVDAHVEPTAYVDLEGDARAPATGWRLRIEERGVSRA